MEKELFVVTFVTNCKLYSNNFTTLQYLNDNSEVSPESCIYKNINYTNSVCVCVCIEGGGGGGRGGQEPNKQPWWLTNEKLIVSLCSCDAFCPYLLYLLVLQPFHCDLPLSLKIQDIGEHWKWEMEGSKGVLLGRKLEMALEEGEG